MRPASGPSYIPTLDGWRAVAIVGVLLHHAFNPAVYGRVFDLGMLGVMLFFAISGYLITNRMLLEWDRTGGLSLKNFYLRRVFRILPPAFFYLAVVFVLGYLKVIVCNGWEVLACIAFLRNYATSNVHWYTSHFWSLSVEEHFYMVWPAILVAVGRKRALWVAPCLAVAIVLWRVVDGHFNLVAHLLQNPALINNPFRTDYCADGLFWGCALALWLALKPQIPRFVGTPLCLAIAAVVLGARYFGIAHNYAIVGPGMVALILCTVTQPQSMVSKFLELAPLRFVGKISYSLYLWQMLFLVWGNQAGWQKLPLNIAFAVLCALFSYYVIEKPFIKLGHRLTHTAIPTPVLEPEALAS